IDKHDPQTYLLYGGYDPLTVTITHLLNNKAGIGWTSYKHTGVPVPTSAIGVGANLFNGYYDNTDIAKKIMQVMGIKPKVYFVESPRTKHIALALN
ncbi:MAG: alkaline phosphatase, partial [Desulfonauticus sp.]|nr:alkaline phosphatase [Desulfonauticus sp.]